MTSARRSESGFSLIELLIVVVIIGIIAAIAIPLLERARQPANAASAINSLRLIHSCELSYRNVHNRFADIPMLAGSGFLDDGHLRTGQKSSYLFNVTLDADPAQNFDATATPLYDPPRSEHYFLNATGVIHVRAGAPADATSPPIN